MASGSSFSFALDASLLIDASLQMEHSYLLSSAAIFLFLELKFRMIQMTLVAMTKRDTS